MGPVRGGPESRVGRGRGWPKRARVEQPVAGLVLGARVETERDAQIPLGQLGEMASETLATIVQMVQAELRGRGAETARLEEVARAEREAQATLEAQTTERIDRELEAETLAASRRGTEAERVRGELEA